MTDSGPPEEAPHSPDPAATDGSLVPVAADDGAVLARPGLRTFSLEHRVAPGLYLVGWLACLVGLGLFIVSVLSGPSLGRTILLVVALLLLSLGLIAGAGQQTLERRAQGWTRYAGPSPFLVFAAVVPISLLLALAAGYAFSLFGLGLDSGLGIVAGSLATAVPSVLLVRMLVIGTGALTVADLGFARPVPGVVRDLATGAASSLPRLPREPCFWASCWRCSCRSRRGRCPR